MMRPTIRFLRIGGVVVVVALVLAACGETSTSTTEPTGTTATSTTTSIAPSDDTSSTSTSGVDPTESSVTTTQPDVSSSTSSTSAASTSTTLPGEPFDIVPPNGTPLAVVGVSFDDVLNVRAGPGTSFEIVARLAPTATMLSTGEARLLPGSIWYQVSTGSTTGWVNSSFTGQLGAVDDVTSGIVASLGEIPTAASMLELGRIAAEARASVEPVSRITVTVAPTSGDLGEVTYDVVGIGDDAVLGERLHVFGQPDGGGGFSLMAVESQILCGRAVTDDGLCV